MKSISTTLVVIALVSQAAIAAVDENTQITDAHVKVPHDTVPRFANIPDAGLPTITNLTSGTFSDPSIWPANTAPGTNARIQIAPNTTVTYDLDSETRFDCIEVGDDAHLTFATDQPTKLHLNELMVMPSGELTIGSETSPIDDDASAEIIFRGDTGLKAGTLESPGIDPRQYGRGLLVFGKVTMHGRKLAKSFLRFSKEPLSGETTLELEAIPTGWKNGDTLLIPDTRQIQFTSNHQSTSQAEEITIASINGSTITLAQPLAHDHRGPRDVEGNVGPIELSMLPHVGNLTRNIIIRSETPDEIDRRGHTIFFHRADLDLRYANFQDLGRTTIEKLDNTTFNEEGMLTKIGTNQIGRYSIHLHHVWGPENSTNTGYQLHVVGNVMNGMCKWGMTIHDTHYGLIQENIAYDGKGSAIATEDGNEAFNVFERNFVVHTKAGDTQPILGHSVGRGGVFNTRALFGTTRDAFWFSGEYNYVRDNVAANTPDFAFNYNGYYIKDTMKVPRFRGANMNDPLQYEGWNYHGRTANFDPDRDVRQGLPVLESARNEAYSSGQGLWLTWARGCCSVSYYAHESLFKDYRLWHINHTGVYAFHESRNTYRGFILRNDPAVSLLSGPNARLNRGFYFGNSSYENGQLIISDFDVQGFNIGITLPPKPEDGTEEENITLVENGILKNHINIRERYASLSDGKKTIIRNVRFTPFRTYASNALPEDPLNIVMDNSRDQRMRPMVRSQLFVYDFNGEPGNSFQVYWKEQAPDAIIPPPTRVDLHGGNPDFTCPADGLSNQLCLQQFGLVTAGAIAPCVAMDGGDCSLSEARAAALDIEGLVFPLIPTIGLTYQAWQQSHFTPAQIADSLISGMDADPDLDHHSNLFEYATGTDPLVSSSPSIRALHIPDRPVTFSLVIPIGRLDVQYDPQLSQDLLNWASNPTATTIDHGDGNASHFYSASDENSLYFRLHVLPESEPN